MLAALGLFVFERATLPFSQRTRRTDWRHARAARIGARDATQFVGPGEDTITVSGCIMPEAGGRHTALDELRAMADSGESFAFVEGTGRVIGNFVIVALDEKGEAFIDNGLARKTDFAIDLLRVA